MDEMDLHEFRIPALPPVNLGFHAKCTQIIQNYDFFRGKFDHVGIVITDKKRIAWQVYLSSTEKSLIFPSIPVTKVFPGYVPFIHVTNMSIMKNYVKNIAPPYFKHSVSIVTSINWTINNYWCITFEEPEIYDHGGDFRNPFESESCSGIYFGADIRRTCSSPKRCKIRRGKIIDLADEIEKDQGPNSKKEDSCATFSEKDKQEGCTRSRKRKSELPLDKDSMILGKPKKLLRRINKQK